MFLEHYGYEHLRTSDEQEALAILRSQSVDLFTQDFMRPGVGGWEFLQQMKSDESLLDIPILGVSAGPRDMRAEQARRIGLDLDRDLDGYLTKPFGQGELLDAIEAALKKHSKPVPEQAAQRRMQSSRPPAPAAS